MENNAKERRIAGRFKINYLMRYCRANSTKRFHTFFNDVSEKGLRFLAKECLPSSTPVFIELNHDTEPISLNGKVVWNNALDKNFYELGVSFDAVPAENKESLNRYIQSLKTKLQLAVILFLIIVGLTIPLEAAMHKEGPSKNSQNASCDVRENLVNPK